MRTRRVLLVMAVPLALFACGDDDDDDAADTTTAAADTTTAAVSTTVAGTAGGAAASEIMVTATDYKFEGLPATAAAGSAFALQNDSDKEVHEMIFQRIPDDVTQSVGELLALPEDELTALVGDEEPALVIVALPGEEGEPVLGDGTINEAGRYAVLCFIPVGADPAVVEEAMSAPPGTGTGPEEPPDMGDGPPHIMEGMYAEITIE